MKPLLIKFKEVLTVNVYHEDTVTSTKVTPIITLTDNGMSMNIFVSEMLPHEPEYNTIEDIGNILTVDDIPYTHEEVMEHILQNFENLWEKEVYATPADINSDAWNEIIGSLKSNSLDLSVEAWRIEVVNGLTTLGHNDWKEWKKSNAN